MEQIEEKVKELRRLIAKYKNINCALNNHSAVTLKYDISSEFYMSDKNKNFVIESINRSLREEQGIILDNIAGLLPEIVEYVERNEEEFLMIGTLEELFNKFPEDDHA